MAAKLTSSGITFSDGTVMASKRDIFAQFTHWIFHQASAPTGWTKLTADNNKALRVVSGTGGGTGGTQPFTTVCSPSLIVSGGLETATSTTGTQLAVSQIASHAHTQPGRFVVAAVPALYNPAGQFTGWNGGDLRRAGGWTRFTGAIGNPTVQVAFHSHPVSAVGSVNTTISMGVRYMNIIVCRFAG